jgi:hypothetical protein
MEQKWKEKGCSGEQDGEKKKRDGAFKEDRRCLKKRQFICIGGN